MSIQSGSSSNSSSQVGYSYGVFLSFRGEDTRKNFTDHLYSALVQAGVRTFRDDNGLRRGEKISQQLLKAIEESKISIVVFSKGYASSTWCLEELAKIMECKNTISQIVLPIFYDTEPSDIRKQTGSFAEAFTMHEERFKEEMEKVNKWRRALEEASNLSGYHLEHMANGHESTFIQNIVKDVSNELNRKYFHTAKHLVGIDSHVEKIFSRLRNGTNRVGIVGIHGMSGIGKTTIAKVLFNQLRNGFEGSCFLNSVAEESKQHNGLAKLQEELLRDILKQDSWKIKDKDIGINLINELLSHKRVLVVLDDVENQEQLDALTGEGCLFGFGSIIIITTRNELVLNQFEEVLNPFEVVLKYKVELLNKDESLQLFSLHAFRATRPPKDYVELSKRIVDYSGRLPLALKVLGSCLLQKDKHRWKSFIDKLRKNPNHDIQKKLRISFDTLEDSKLQKTFLDIACFFIGQEKEYVAKVLEARCGFNPEDDLGTLIERSLITINVFSKIINMHDLLRDMGREIICDMYPGHPGKHTRIWRHEDAWDVLNQQTGTELVEGLALDVRASKAKPLCTKSFKKMKHLQLLKINGLHLTGSFEVLPKGLIWLCWHGCPLKSLPSDFELSNLVILDMQYSNIKELWKETKILNKLKTLNLSYCEYLAKLPDFLGISNLERLILQNCTSLGEVPESIGHLEMLVLLNLEGCCRLKILSDKICDVKSLETLNVSGCSQLEKLPERMGDMESLTELLADGIENEQFRSSIGHLKYVRKLSLRGYSSNQNSPSSTSLVSAISSWLRPRDLNLKAFAGWSLLGKLNLAFFGLSEGAMNCVDFGGLSSLEKLDLSGNKFVNLPSGIGCLPKLHSLDVRECGNLLLISELPSSLKSLFAYDCTSMERIRLPTQSKSVPLLYTNGCQNLMETTPPFIGTVEAFSHNDPGRGIYLCERKIRGVINALHADGCPSMERVRLLIQSKIGPLLFINDCRNMMTIYGTGSRFRIRNVGHRHPLLSEPFKRNLFKLFSDNDSGCEIYFQESEIPDWFSYRGEKCSLSFQLPPFFQGLALWIVYKSFGRVIIKNKSEGIQLFTCDISSKTIGCFDSWVRYVRKDEMVMEECCGDELELYLEITDEDRNDIGVKEIGVHVIVENLDSFKESKSEWDDGIDNLQGATSCINVHIEEEDKTDSQSKTDIMINKIYTIEIAFANVLTLL